MDAAEQLAADHPDSALAVLATVEPGSLWPEADHARFALLKTRCLHRAYIPLADDSLIAVAVSYYDRAEMPHERMMAHMLLGCVHHDCLDYISAMAEYKLSAQIAESIEDHFNAGIIYSYLTELCSVMVDADELFYSTKSLEHFMQTDCPPRFLNWTRFYVAMARFKKQSVCNADSLEMLYDAATREADTLLMIHMAGLGADYHLQQRNIEAARKNIAALSRFKDSPSAEDYGMMALLAACSGHADSARVYLELSAQSLHPDDKQGLKNREYYAYMVAKELGDSRRALERFEQFTRAQNAEIMDILAHSVSTVQRDYLTAQLDHAADEAKYKSHLLIIVVVASVVVVVLLVIVMLTKIRQRRAEAENLIAIAHEMSLDLKSRTYELTTMRERTSSHAMELFRQRFELIDRLCTVYYEKQNTTAERNSIYHNVIDEIEGFKRDDSLISGLEDLIERCSGSCLAALRQLNQMKPDDYRLLCYVLAGLSNRTISILISDKIDNVYQKRSRLKAKLRKLGTPEAETILKMLK